MLEILPIDTTFRGRVDALIKEEWHGPLSVTKGIITDTSKCPGFVAAENGEMLGAITYQIQGDECEIITLNSLREGIGVGTSLISAVKETAAAAGCRRLWLCTTNDNTHAIRFYQRYGFTLAAVHINALNRSRELKPCIPLIGMDGISLQHEFEFEITLRR